MISSAQPVQRKHDNSWNNTTRSSATRRSTTRLSKYFTDMLRDKKDLNYFRVTTSGKYTIYLYPQTARRSDDIVWMKALNQTSCKTDRQGYGNRERPDAHPGGELGLDARRGSTSPSGCGSCTTPAARSR